MSRGAVSRLVWLSDLHYQHDGDILGHDPRVRLDAAISYINTHYADADLCLITGDLVDVPRPEDYTGLKARLDGLALPWRAIPGNHDDRAMFLEHLGQPEGAMPGYGQFVIEAAHARLICLDTVLPGSDAGILCPARMDWLRAALEADPETPVAIFMHHHPMALEMPALDTMKLENGDAFLDLLGRHSQVRQICFGHIHRTVAGHINGIAYCSLRSALLQVPPPVPDWDFDNFHTTDEPPEMGVIRVAPGHIGIQTLPFCAATVGRYTE